MTEQRTPKEIAQDFCDWWNVGSQNDTATKKALREDAVSELEEIIKSERNR